MHKLIESAVKSKLTSSTLFLVSIIFVQPLFALEFECSAGSDRRFIRMELPGIEHLCEVSVTYTDDERKVMWYAKHNSMFCSEKTDELRNKYVNKWNFSCKQWPDHDGVDRLSIRQRQILDAELKSLITQGQNEITPFMVEGVKVAASPTPANDDDVDLLVFQFFLHSPSTGYSRDVTHIIRDEGASWSTLSIIDTLANHIDAEEDYVVNSALISSVTSNGALEIITVLDSNETSNINSTDMDFSGCYGNQILATSGNGELVARTPHRYYCPKAEGAESG